MTQPQRKVLLSAPKFLSHFYRKSVEPFHTYGCTKQRTFGTSRSQPLRMSESDGTMPKHQQPVSAAAQRTKSWIDDDQLRLSPTAERLLVSYSGIAPADINSHVLEVVSISSVQMQEATNLIIDFSEKESMECVSL